MPWWDELGDKAGPAAGWGTGIAVVFGFLYRFFFKSRADLRADRGAERIDDGYEKFLERHAKLIERQDAEISRQSSEIVRLVGLVGTLTDDLIAERKAIHELRREIVKLETQLLEAMQRITYLNGKERS